MARLAIFGAALLALALAARAADQPQWGQKFTRNMVSAETGLPDSFDPKSGKNIRWRAALGSQSYGTPTVGGGCVLIGTNNANPRDPRQRDDCGVLLCFDEKDGALRWQLVVPKREADPFQDWPRVGMASAPTIEGDRVYTLTNRAEVVCLDLAGMANGNDGPYQDEGKHMTPKGAAAALTPGPKDADILWLFNLVAEVGIWPHDTAHSSILIHGDYLYINTGNGVDNTHRKIRSPDAPSLIVLDKKTGKLVAQDEERIGDAIVHATWSSPSMGEVGGQTLIFFTGGDGIVRAFKALAPGLAPGGTPAKLEKVWWFDPEPLPRPADHAYMGDRRQGPSDSHGMPVFVGGRLYVAGGGDFQWGKHEGWVKCIDVTKTGNVTQTATLWSYTAMKDTCATPAVFEGMVFVTDCGGTLHCLDATTGKPFWTHPLEGDLWGSALVADGKVYVGSQRGDFCILAAAKKKKVLSTADFGGVAATATPVAANGTLYLGTHNTLYAVGTAKGSAK
jgi:outer membrane protein assembly factor BamB